MAAERASFETVRPISHGLEGKGGCHSNSSWDSCCKDHPGLSLGRQASVRKPHPRPGSNLGRLASIEKLHPRPAEVVVGSAAWIGRGLSCVCAQRTSTNDRVSITLTPFEERRLQRLQRRIEASFDGTRPEHQEALKDLWHAAFPGRELHSLISEQWKEMGWQGRDPSTDFRGGGLISLENLLFFAKTYPKPFQRLLQKQQGDRSMWEYPFAIAGVNITFMLIQMLDLRSAKPSTIAGAVFLKMLSGDEWAFDLLYCIAFEVMDAQWLAMRASYMDFNAVLKSTRAQLEKELLIEEISRIEDLPAYGLICQ